MFEKMFEKMFEWLLVTTLMLTTPNGESIYKANKCAVCHSIAGVGNKKGPLDGVGSRLTKKQLHKAVTDPTPSKRKPAMKPYVLPDEELTALVNYLSTLK